MDAVHLLCICCAFAVQFIVIRMKIETAQPAVQCCADVHFFVVIRTGVSRTFCKKRGCVYRYAIWALEWFLPTEVGFYEKKLIYLQRGGYECNLNGDQRAVNQNTVRDPPITPIIRV
jgi:hypothetical protein